MKNTFCLLFFLYLFTGCDNQQLTHEETVTNYYKARDATNYQEVKRYINDSITITEGDYVMPYDQNSFYEVFKWDSIFQPTYKIVELVEKKNKVMVAVALKSIRNEFLKNSSMTCQYEISFNAGKISKIESLECTGADWNSWQKERDALVNWINQKHPELDGFINDMTMNGAINYLKAIELYETDKTAL